MSNRQLEQEVRRCLPPVTKKTILFVLEGDLIDAWEQAREASERLANQTPTDIQVLEVMIAEVLCTYATTLASPPAEGEEKEGGFARLVADRDGWKCTRPGCSSRTGLHGHHVKTRALGGSNDRSNITTVCAVCHQAITAGRLKVTGYAPDQLVWEGPWGVIEKPLPLPVRDRVQRLLRQGPAKGRLDTRGTMIRESQASYPVEEGARKTKLVVVSDHVITTLAVGEGTSKSRRNFLGIAGR